MLKLLSERVIDIKRFSIEKQVELISKVPDLANDANLSLERKFLIVDKSIELGLNNLISSFEPYFQQNYLMHLKEKGNLNSTLPDILRFLDEDNINKIIRQKNQLIIHLDEKQQIDYIHRFGNEGCFKYINPDIQLKYMQENPKYIKLASDEAQEKFTLLDKNNFQKTSTEFQLRTIAKTPKAFKYASEDTKDKVWNHQKDSMAIDAAIALLKQDIRNSKYLKLQVVDPLEGPHSPTVVDDYLKLFNNIQSEDIETIKKYFLHSKMFAAKGKLLPSDKVLHGTSTESNEGIDDYRALHIDIIQKLKINQIQELIAIDNNYVLPYLTEKDKDDKGNSFILSPQNIDNSKVRCKELFGSMFGKEKFDKIEECINIIYNLQNKRNDSLIKAEKEWYAQGARGKKQYYELMQIEDVPLDQFKILFNKDIINNNSEEIIKEYFKKLDLGQDNSEEFKTLLENAYGTHARETLDSRPGLDVHSINSLEVFDKRIIDNFGEAFVHDLISYNIRDFSSFLEVIKDENKLSNFKTYYNVLTNVMGNNVETMQRAISEYYYNEELLENVKNIELSDIQYDNLISVLCSENNRYNINTLQELQNFDEIANEITRKELEKTKGIDNERQRKERIKQIISEHILGLDYKHSYKTRNYGDSFEYLTSIYDISDEEKRKEMYNDSELQMLQVINFIDKENDEAKLFQVADKLMKEKGIRNPVVIYSSIDKMKEHQTEILNNSFLTIDKMEEACRQESGKENPLITKSIRKDGIVQYSLEGIEFTFLQHLTGGFPLQDILTYEGQLGNNAICSRMIHDKKMFLHSGACGYTHVEKNGIITIYNSEGYDANTNHMPKLVRGTARFNENSKITKKVTTKDNEVSFHRRLRNHDNISNDNLGGKILPDVFITDTENCMLNMEDTDFLKKHNIPIVYINQKKYKELQQKQEKEEQYEDKTDEGR